MISRTSGSRFPWERLKAFESQALLPRDPAPTQERLDTMLLQAHPYEALQQELLAAFVLRHPLADLPLLHAFPQIEEKYP